MAQTSSYREDKWRCFFAFLDTDRDGLLTFNDFDNLSRKFATTTVLTKCNARKVENAWMKWWCLMEHVLTDTILELSERMFLGAMRILMDSGPDVGVRRTFDQVWESLFDAIDEDGDGHVTLKQLAEFYRWHGSDGHRQAEEVFRRFGVRDDLTISGVDFQAAMESFWFSDDPNDDSLFMFSDNQLKPVQVQPRRQLLKTSAAQPLHSVKNCCCTLI